MAALRTERADGFLALPEQVVAAHATWRFSRESVVDPMYAAEFYDLYRMAFTPLATRSVARQVLTATEFNDQMADSRIDKYIAWNDRGMPVGITTLTKHLDAIPWISPDYFRARYPEHWRRNVVYYLGFTLAHPSLRHQRFLETIIRVGINPLVDERAVLAYDVCAYNNAALRFQERIEDVLSHYPGVELETIDTQTYYSVSFS